MHKDVTLPSAAETLMHSCAYGYIKSMLQMMGAAVGVFSEDIFG